MLPSRRNSPGGETGIDQVKQNVTNAVKTFPVHVNTDAVSAAGLRSLHARHSTYTWETQVLLAQLWRSRSLHEATSQVRRDWGTVQLLRSQGRHWRNDDWDHLGERWELNMSPIDYPHNRPQTTPHVRSVRFSDAFMNRGTAVAPNRWSCKLPLLLPLCFTCINRNQSSKH